MVNAPSTNSGVATGTTPGVNGSSNGNSNRGARLVLAALALGLAAILITIAVYRVRHPSLVRLPEGAMPSAPTSSASRDTAPASPGGMPPSAMGAVMGMEEGSPAQAATVAAMQRLQADPNDVDAMLDLANVFMGQQNFGSAQGFVNRAMVAAPSDPRPSYYQGVLSSRQEKYAEAAEAMERSLTLGDDPSTRYSLAVIYRYHLGNEAKAREHLEKAAAAIRNDAGDAALRALIEAELAK